MMRCGRSGAYGPSNQGVVRQSAARPRRSACSLSAASIHLQQLKHQILSQPAPLQATVQQSELCVISKPSEGSASAGNQQSLQHQCCSRAQYTSSSCSDMAHSMFTRHRGVLLYIPNLIGIHGSSFVLVSSVEHMHASRTLTLAHNCCCREREPCAVQ